MLVEQRDRWKKEFEKGGRPGSETLLPKYEENRNSDSWRAHSSPEKLCEYILYLEKENKEIKEYLPSRRLSDAL